MAKNTRKAEDVRARKNRHHPIPDFDEDGDIPEDVEESLYLAPDGTMTYYEEGDEEDPNSEWFEHPPTFKVGSTEFCVTDFNDLETPAVPKKQKAKTKSRKR
jgi:hypothetical protein